MVPAPSAAGYTADPVPAYIAKASRTWSVIPYNASHYIGMIDADGSS